MICAKLENRKSLDMEQVRFAFFFCRGFFVVPFLCSAEPPFFFFFPLGFFCGIVWKIWCFLCIWFILMCIILKEIFLLSLQITTKYFFISKFVRVHKFFFFLRVFYFMLINIIQLVFDCCIVSKLNGQFLCALQITNLEQFFEF